MHLIRNIRVEGVGSIRELEITGLGDLNSFVGRNSSGKSNVLRALNLFFNGAIEPNKPLDFARDHFERVPRLKKKKRISISVDFSLPAGFRLRSGLESLAVLGSEFTVTRQWELDQLRRPVEGLSAAVDGSEVKSGDELARLFLSLITYRYIPNRTVPSQLLQDEAQDIANSIFGRMKGDRHASALLEGVVAAAKRMLSGANSSLVAAGSPLRNPEIATADSIGEMLTWAGSRPRIAAETGS